MEKIEGIMGKLFVAAATLGGISCLARADYNLPLFVFVYFMWAHDPVTIFSTNHLIEGEGKDHGLAVHYTHNRLHMGPVLVFLLAFCGTCELGYYSALNCDLLFDHQYCSKGSI